MIVSVPYRGATFLNRNKNIVGNSVRGFPSPIGELHFSIRIVNHLQVQNVFPSPIGELHFSIPSGTRPRRTHQGFRPLSGSYISQFETLNGAVYKPANVSVPYRGATFLNGKNGGSVNTIQKFPSPIGELHFSIPSPQPHVLSGTNRGIAGEK